MTVRRAMLALVCVTVQMSAAGRDGNFAIANVKLFDGVQVHPQATVVVKGDKIQSVHLGDTPILSEDVQKISGEGYTLFPGLIEAHSHVWDIAQLEDTLRFGVTTTLDMAFPIPEVAQRLQATRGKREYSHYADFFSAVVSPTTPGGHGTQMGIEFPTIRYPEEAEAFIADRVAEGSDFIKITMETGPPLNPFTWVPPATLRAMIDASHKHGLLAVAHITDPDIALFAIESGLDGIVHIWAPGVNGGARPDVAAAAKRKGTFFVPTLTVYQHFYDAESAASLLADPDLVSRMNEKIKTNLMKPHSAEDSRNRILLHPSADARRAWVTMKEAARSLYEGGVTILVGTDPANYGTWHGVSVHREMELLTEIGMSPVEVLRAATAAAANAYRLHDRGYILPGMRADLVMVRGDPTTDILHTRKLYKIWKGGVEYTK